MAYDLSDRLFTPSDQFDLAPQDAAVLNKTTGAAVTTFPFTVAFSGDMLPADGTFIIDRQDVGLGAYAGAEIWDRNLNLIASFDASNLTDLDATTSNFVSTTACPQLDCFYIAWCGDILGGTTRVAKVSKAGVILQTWTLPNTGSGPPLPSPIGVSPDGTYLYYGGGTGAVINHILRYNLATSSAASAFLTGTLSLSLQIYVQDNGDLVFLRKIAGTNWAAYRYDASAVLQQTYSIVAAAGRQDTPILGRDQDTDHFWVHTFEFASLNQASYTRYAYADGSSDVTFSPNSRNSGLTNIPLSCPFFVFGAAPEGGDDDGGGDDGDGDGIPDYQGAEDTCEQATPRIGCWSASQDVPAAECAAAHTPTRAACWNAHDINDQQIGLSDS